MEKDNSNADSIRDEHEADLRWERSRRHHRVLTVFLILLTVCLAGAVW
jgi:hypothetical protein